MRLLLAAAALAASFAVPAEATCMPFFRRYGVEIGTCAAPGGEPATYVCVRDTCTWLP